MRKSYCHLRLKDCGILPWYSPLTATITLSGRRSFSSQVEVLCRQCAAVSTVLYWWQCARMNIVNIMKMLQTKCESPLREYCAELLARFFSFEEREKIKKKSYMEKDRTYGRGTIICTWLTLVQLAPLRSGARPVRRRRGRRGRRPTAGRAPQSAGRAGQSPGRSRGRQRRDFRRRRRWRAGKTWAEAKQYTCVKMTCFTYDN